MMNKQIILHLRFAMRELFDIYETFLLVLNDCFAIFKRDRLKREGKRTIKN